MVKEWKFESKIPPPKKSNFDKIIKFYLFECSVFGVSKRGITLKDYGWDTGAKIRQLIKKIKDLGLKDKWIACDSVPDVKNKTEDMGILDTFTCESQIAIYYKRDRLKFASLLYLIRNGLVHGSFFYLYL